MNTKEYIESGILEAFVVGSVSSQERQEVECLSKIYPEIKQALDEIAYSMEGFASSYAIEPPADLKEKIMAQVKLTPQESHPIAVSTEETTTKTQTEAKIQFLKKDPKSFPWRTAAAILLLISCALMYFLVDLDQSYNDLAQEQEATVQYYEEVLGQSKQLLEEKQNLLALTLNKGTDRIILAATQTGSDEEAIVYWHPDTEQVWLDPDQLPTLSENQQYQLWALKDGQPIDLGVVPAQDAELIKMKNIGDADAFAITLEPFGGSAQPTLSQLKVIGEI